MGITIAESEVAETWSVGKSEDLYAVRHWGKGYFSINGSGHIAVHPDKNPERAIDLKQLVDELRERGIQPPVLLRFPGVLRHRLRDIHQVFAAAIRDCSYRGDYRCVYPIKVNQQRHVVEEIFEFGKEFGFGLEAGSKSELLAVLALADDESTPIVGNGFKDSEYIETVVLAQKLGKTVLPVIESMQELQMLVDCAAAHGVTPAMGVRVKLATRGAGRWESSGGRRSKFGLSVGELLETLRFLSERNLADQLKLLHFHIGSQITNIRKIKEALNEAARIYVELVKAGAGLEFLNVGGGLGVDYDGSQTNFGSSVNYTLEEYAADVVFSIQSICDQAGVAHPTIISESGRAVAAYYSVLVFNVLGVTDSVDGPAPSRPAGTLPAPIANLFDTLGDISTKNLLEMHHDAVKYRDDAMSLFNLGYLSLPQRDVAEQLFWAICRKIERVARRTGFHHEDLRGLESMLSDTYFCNFSVFQSMPDSWAVQQLFPIVPIHRLRERPGRRATLADITCDSDGKIDRFIDLRDVKSVLPLHALDGEEYYLGAFLVGAYQEILGDLHNLFGDTHAVHVTLGDDGQAEILTVIRGDRVRDVLQYVQFSADELSGRLRRDVQRAVASKRMSPQDGEQLMRFYNAGLDGYTYLE